MRVLVRPPAAAAAFEGWAVRRNWLEGHEFMAYRASEDEAMEYALADQRLWVDIPGQVAHAVVPIEAVAYEQHARLLCASGLCTSPVCPVGTPLASVTPVTVGEAR